MPDDLETANAPAEGGWKFDASVTDAFDDMLARSIPQYDVMRKVVADAACWFADPLRFRDPVIVDLGTSRGSALAPILDRLGARARYRAFEISEPMLDVVRERFSGFTDAGVLRVDRHDLRDGYPSHAPAAAILSVLTLQFVPIEHRQRLLRGVWENLRDGGAFVWVEKVLGATASLDALEVDLYYGVKREAGYTQEAIDRKRLSLEGVLVPLTAAFNEALLRGAGFAQVDTVWAYMNFRCWVAIKG